MDTTIKNLRNKWEKIKCIKIFKEVYFLKVPKINHI